MNFVKPTRSVASVRADVLPPLPQPRRWPISYRSVGAIAVAADIATILACGTIPATVYNFEEFGLFGAVLHYLGAAAVVAAFFVSVMRGNDLYSPSNLLDFRSQIGGVTTTWLGVFLFLAGAVFAMKIGSNFSRVAIFAFAGSGLGFLVAERVFYRSLLKKGLSQQKFSGQNAVLITDQQGPIAGALANDLLKYGVRLNRQFALPRQRQDASEQEAFVSDVVAHLRGSDVEQVIIGVDLTCWRDLGELFSGLRKLPLQVVLIPVGTAADIFDRPSHVIGDCVYIELQRQPLGAFERTTKRIIDLIISTAALIVLSPLLTIVTVLIKLDSTGPVLFRQKRCGFNGRQFDIFKFRTMSVLEDGVAVCQATRSDKRVTRVGRWLRRSSIDELPQFINVLSGSMSLVGPRPHALVHDNQFDKVVSNYAFRHHVKPGLTGWAQVNGQRGPTPTVEEIRRRVEFDLWYIDHWSLRLDFLIILRTIFEVMRGRNAY
jgi:Undecaprenyl-phosphate glucose phosphotransferase